MEVPVIPNIPISIAIKKKRKRDEEKRKQKEIEKSNVDFKIPCKNHQNKRVQCVSFTLEDLQHFRERFLKIPDRFSQDNFLAQYLKISTPQRRRPRKLAADVSKSRNFHVDYTLETISGLKWGVCKAMFLEALGIKRKRLSAISQQLYEKSQMETIQEKPRKKYRKTIEREKIQQEQRESLAKPTETVIVEDPAANLEADPGKLVDPANKSEPPIMELGIFENFCRICLQSGEFESLFESSSENQSYADQLEDCFGIKIEKTEGLPENICRNCVERLEAAMSLKSDFLETKKVIIDYMGDSGNLHSIKNEESAEENLEILEELEVIPSVSQDDVDFSVIEDLAGEVEEDLPQISSMKPTKKTSKITTESAKTMRPEKCFLCDVDFEDSPEAHFELNHKEIKQMKCKLCDFDTFYPWFLNLHYQVHQNATKLCDNCGKVVKTTSFFSHVGHCTRNKDGMKRFACSYCPLRYHKPYLLKVHERTHSGETPYSCSVCNLAFSKKILLRKHLLLHGATPEFECDICQKGFIVKNRLLAHQASCQKQKIYQKS